MLRAGSAQDHRSFFSVSAGPSFPLGAFPSKKAGDGPGGYVRTGENLGISYEYLPHGSWGLTGMLLGYRNPIDTRALAASGYRGTFSFIFGTNMGTDPYELLHPSSPPPPTGKPAPKITFNHASWLNFGLLVGGIRRWGLSPDRKLSLKAMTGIDLASSPRFRAAGGTDTTDFYLYQRSRKGIGFCYRGGARLDYRTGRQVTLPVAADFFGTGWISFQRTKTITTTLWYTERVLGEEPSLSSLSSVMTTMTQRTTKTRISVMGLRVGMGRTF